MKRLKQLIHETHRRSLWQVLGIYVVGGWLILQVVDTLAGALNLPDWASPLALFLLIIGLPIVLATAFVQEGVGRRDAPSTGAADRTAGGTPIPGVSAGETGSRKGLFTWRNAVLGGMAAFALWGVGAAGWMIFFGAPGEASGPGPRVAASEARIAVLPFSVRGGEEYAYLHEGLVDLLSTKLDGAGDLRTVDPQALLNAVEVEVDESIDPAAAQRIARQFGAGRYVTGNVVEAGGRISVRASLYGNDGDAETTAEAIAESEAELFEMVDDLARQLLAGHEAAGSARLTQIGALTTRSLPALKAFLEGTARFRDGLFDEATDAFARSVAIDSTFALAYYRLSVAIEWNEGSEDQRLAAEQAVRLSDRLSPRDRLLLEARQTWSQGDGVTAARLYQQIVSAYPDDVEAWFQLSEVTFHYGPPNGRPVRLARDRLERVLELEPDHVPAMYHLIRLEALDGDTASVRSTVDRILALNPQFTWAPMLQAVLAFSVQDSAAINEVLSQPANTYRNSSVDEVAVFVQDLDGALTLAATLTDPLLPLAFRAAAHGWLADIHLGAGNWQAAVEEVERLGSLPPDGAADHLLGMYAATSPIRRSDDEVRALRDRLSDQDLRTLSNSEGEEALDLPAAIHTYVLGLLSARLGDESSARAAAAALDTMVVPPTYGSLPQDLASSVRARLAYAAGDERAALELIRAQKRQIDYGVGRDLAFASRGYDRYLVGTILQDEGNYEEALTWYESIEGHALSDLPFLAPSHLRRAEIYEEMGDSDRAALHYREFVALWANADPEYQPLVEEATARLLRLRDDIGD